MDNSLMLPKLIFVDCEATGPAPVVGHLTEFGAVDYDSRETFYGRLHDTFPHPANPAIPVIDPSSTNYYDPRTLFLKFETWLSQLQPLQPLKQRPIFVSDNPAYDWQWINYMFHLHVGRNPFGFSARRIGDYYAGLQGDFSQTQDWKKLRKTTHDHNPVNDAMGNVEAFAALQQGIRP